MMNQEWYNLTEDVEFWKFVEVPSHYTDEQFLKEIIKKNDFIEELDCSEACNLSQEAFIQLSRKEITFSRLRKLTIPNDANFTNLMYEYLAGSSCFPALEQLCNVRSNANNTCEPLRCQAFFKQAALKVLYDAPVAVYGRLKRLPLDPVFDRQHRSRWESDLAKAAISCQHIVEYRCERGIGYVDDKSLERISVLFPNLKVLELQHCTATDDGIARFIAHNNPGQMCHIAFDQVFGLTDKGLQIIADHCSNLTYLKLIRCCKVTTCGVKYVIERCSQLKEIHLNTGCISSIVSTETGNCGSGLKKMGSEINLSAGTDYYSGERCRKSRSSSSGNVFNYTDGSIISENVDDDCLVSLGKYCHQLKSLEIYNSSLISQRGLNGLQRIDAISKLTLYNCARIGDDSLNIISHLPALRLLTLVNCVKVTPKGVVDVILDVPHLICLTLGCCSELFYGDVAAVAEHAYDALSCTVSGCLVLSDLQCLSVSGVGGGFLRLLTVLCSNITTLDIRPDQETRSGDIGCIAVVDLVEVLTICRKLKSLDVAGVILTDEFLYCICEQSDELRHLAMREKTDQLSLPALIDVIRLAPSLASLHIDMHSKILPDVSKSENGLSTINIENRELEEMMKKYHGGHGHFKVKLNIADNLSCSPRFAHRYIQLSFMPLKFLKLQNYIIKE